MRPARRFPTTALLVVAGLIVAAILVVVVAMQPRYDRIVDCAPGYHNVSGPASDCIPNPPGASSPSLMP